MQQGIKVVVIGPESTGKSTLAETLAHRYHASWVKEYAREYLDGIDRPYKREDLWNIAQGQIKAEDDLSEPLLFCDTDLYVIKVWSEQKYNTCDHRILQQIARRKYDLYLLTYIDIPWTPDPQREYPDPRMRSYFYYVYQDLVIHSGVPWVKIWGDHEQRLQIAERAIEKYGCKQIN